MFLSRVSGHFVDKVVLRNNSASPGIGHYTTTIVLDILLGFGTATIVAKLSQFSLYREFRSYRGADHAYS